MKYQYIISLIILFPLFSCDNQKTETKNTNESSEVENLEEIKDGVYTKWQKGKKQIQGKIDGDSLKNGEWFSYFKDGTKNSMTTYKSGIKNGKSWVNHPNGKRYYQGSYMNDKKSGLWKFNYSNGKRHSEGNYINNKRSGAWKFYSKKGELEEKNFNKMNK